MTTLLEEGRLASFVRTTKVQILRARRLARWALEKNNFPGPITSMDPGSAAFSHLLYQAKVAIRRGDTAAHPVFEEGKEINLRLAAPAFDGIVLSPGRPFSFWRTLGRIDESLGYQPGMELRGGCIIPAIGGGICLLSNALFAMAARLGLVILERHGHTLEAIPSKDELFGMDATVFWPYVDLRFQVPISGKALRLYVRVEGGELVLLAYGQPAAQRIELSEVGVSVEESQQASMIRKGSLRRRIIDSKNGALVEDAIISESRRKILGTTGMRRNCLTCGETSCHSRDKLVSITLPKSVE